METCDHNKHACIAGCAQTFTNVTLGFGQGLFCPLGKKDFIMLLWPSDRLHRETMDFLRLSTVLHTCQNILSEKEQWTFLWRQEVLLSLKDKLSRAVANYLVIEV